MTHVENHLLNQGYWIDTFFQCQKDHKCNACEKDFSLWIFYLVFVEVHHGQKDHNCDSCGISFAQPHKRRTKCNPYFTTLTCIEKTRKTWSVNEYEGGKVISRKVTNVNFVVSITFFMKSIVNTINVNLNEKLLWNSLSNQ